MAQHNELGKWGEDLATGHMLKLGYAIAGRNIRQGRYELDIIAVKGDVIAFVEVKTRRDDFADPLEAIDEMKMRKMARAADSYLRERKIRANPQFDVITVTGTPDTGYELVHYPDAFFPPLQGH